jgi:hypothetical protein
VTTVAALTPEELLAGRDAVFDIEVPAGVLRPTPDGERDAAGAARAVGGRVRLRPLTVSDVQLIAKGAKDDEVLTSILMIQRALVDPKLDQAQIAGLHGGLVGYLVERINRISGLVTSDDELRALSESPLAQALLILAREFHWTPTELRAMTVGEVLAYLELTHGSRGPA